MGTHPIFESDFDCLTDNNRSVKSFGIDHCAGVKMAKFIKEADNVAGDILKDFRDPLIAVGRVLLVSTFIEDAIRMWHQWQDHKDYIGNSWSFTDEIATFIVLVNLVGQCTGSFLVLFRVLVTPSVLLLACIVVLQTIVYSIIQDVKFLMRHLAMIGALCLLLAEHQNRQAKQAKQKTVNPGLPILDEKKPKDALQLFGRIFLVLLFCTLMHFSKGVNPPNKDEMPDAIDQFLGFKKEIVSDAVGLMLVILVAVGLRTRLCSVILIIWLGTLNFFVNDFWSHSNTSVMHDFKRYDFFQTLTVIGGLKLLLALGPGHMALDQKKDT